MLGSSTVNEVRSALGDHLEPIPYVRTRWYIDDIERIYRQLASGDLTRLGELALWLQTGDGVTRGLLDVRTSVVNFPQLFYGPTDVVDILRATNASDRSVFDEMVPSTDLRCMAADGIVCGVGVGEMVPVKGRDFPVFVRHYPQNLFYLWQKNTWFYRSAAGMVPIVPGVPDQTTGNWWVLHIPGGRLYPWNSGLWPAIGRAAISKNMSWFARMSWEQKHAHPARVAKTQQGSSQSERDSALDKLIAWALNGAFVLPQGWEVGLVESNGRGHEVYSASIENANKDIATSLCGSTVMFEGGKGFSGTDAFQIVQRDLINGTADALAHTINTQILPPFIAQRWGLEALRDATRLEYDTKDPADRETATRIWTGLGAAIKSMNEALMGSGREVDIDELVARFDLPTREAQTPRALPEGATPEPDDTTTSG